MSGNGGDGMTLRELAERAGVAPRTVRYYVARGLLPPPEGRGRAARYGREHLERLERIRQLRAGGLTLAEIGVRLGGPPAEAVPVERWTALVVAPDVTVMVREDAPPWRRRLVARAAAELRAALGEATNETGGGR